MEDSGDRFEDFERELIDRQRGMLTKSDREFLWGALEEPLDENARNQKRYHIRRRVRDSIADFAFLQALPEEDVKLIFEDYHTEEPPIDLELGAWAAVQWLYVALGRDQFIHLVETAIEIDRMEQQPGHLVRANIQVTLEEVETDAETVWSADDYDGPEDPELTDATVEIMKELDDGDGADTEKVVATVVDRHGVTEDEAEQAIQDALFTGQCYEPDDSTLKPI